MKRFWSKVNKTASCWLWTASCHPKGYGQFRLDGTMHRAHRIAWQLTNGTIAKGLCVCHHCDNKNCVRPSHLWLGTVRENNQDHINKLAGRPFGWTIV